MKGLNDFFNHINSKVEIKEAFANSTDLDEVCSKAKKYGYQFTKNELKEAYLENISGGGGLFSSSSDSHDKIINAPVSVNGDGSTQVICGGVNFNQGDSGSRINSSSGIDPSALAALSIIFGNQ